MPASLKPTVARAVNALDRTEKLLDEAIPLPVNLQRIAGEMLFLRTATIVENTFSSVALKLLCGADYLDGSASAPVVRARSLDNAIYLMQTHGWKKQRGGYTKWLNVGSIKDWLKYTLPATEHYLTSLDRFQTQVEEIRKIRNHIAHESKSTERDYRAVVLSYYGPTSKLIPCGVMLMSKAIDPNTMLRKSIKTARVIVRGICKG